MNRTGAICSVSLCGGAKSAGAALKWITVLLVLFCPLSAQGAPTIPVPDWVKTTPVADKMIVNGIPSQVVYFEAERDVEEVLQFYRRAWQDKYAGHAGYREAHVEPWHIISRLEQRHLLTVQVRRSSALNADGYLAVAELDEISAEKNAIDDIPMMGGSKVLNRNISFDPGKKGEVMMLGNRYSVAVNSRFYRDYYRDRGWGVLQDQGLSDARAMAFRRFGTEIRLVVKKADRGTVVVINRVSSN